MKKLFSTRVKGILIAALVIAVLCSVIALVRSDAGPVRNLLNAALSPVRSAATSLAERVESFYNYLYRYELIEAENASLKAQLAEAGDTITAAMDRVLTDPSSRTRDLGATMGCAAFAARVAEAVRRHTADCVQK